MTNIVRLSPIWIATRFADSNNNLLAAGQIFTYEAGSDSVEQTTWSDQAGTVANPNPIVLDSSGLNSTEIWLSEGVAYKLVLKDSNGNVIVSADNIIGYEPSVVPGGTSGDVNLWNSAPTPTYVSGTIFVVPGNYVTQFAVGNRVQFTNGIAGNFYGTVTAVAYSSPNTQVTIQPDSTAITSALSAVYWSALAVNGITVDAAAVSWTSGITYAGTSTVGGYVTTLKNTVTTDLNTLTTAVAGLNVVFQASGGPTAYSITPTPPAASYSANQVYDVKFNVASSGSPTLNVSGLGGVGLVQLDTAGTYVAAVLSANQTTRVLYDGSQFVVQNPIPVNAGVAAFRHANPGYIEFADGTVQQWGSTGTIGDGGTVTFPLRFPNACTSVVISISERAEIAYVQGYNRSVTGFTVGLQDSSSNPTSATISWCAFGY